MPLNSIYAGENQLQAINHTANAIEKDTGIAVVRCHLGNPMGPEYARTNAIVAEHYQGRAEDPSARGYADVAGEAGVRRAIAMALCAINRLPAGSLKEANILGVTGGTGALNVALSIFGSRENPPTVLVSEPFYPPWENISKRLQCDFATFPLRKEDSYLLNESVLAEKIATLTKQKPDGDVVLIYHYPNNPTGKTLTEDEAKQLGATLNSLCKRFPNLKLVQEDLYLATTAPELGIYTPLPYLDAQTKERTVWLHSPSKMGHQRDRAAVVAAFNPDLLQHLRGASSADILGTSSSGLLATANTLMHIAQGGVDAVDAKGSRPDNHRFVTARFYQERLKPIFSALKDIEAKTGQTLMDGGIPKGSYYLYPSFDLLKGKAIPQELRGVFGGKTTFENGNDVTTALANAHLLGLRPVTTAPGTLFSTDENTMAVRFSTVDPNIENLVVAGNTVKGLVQKTLGVELGATFSTIDELKARPQQAGATRAKPPLRWVAREDGNGRQWEINP